MKRTAAAGLVMLASCVGPRKGASPAADRPSPVPPAAAPAPTPRPCVDGLCVEEDVALPSLDGQLVIDSDDHAHVFWTQFHWRAAGALSGPAHGELTCHHAFQAGGRWQQVDDFLPQCVGIHQVVAGRGTLFLSGREHDELVVLEGPPWKRIGSFRGFVSMAVDREGTMSLAVTSTGKVTYLKRAHGAFESISSTRPVADMLSGATLYLLEDGPAIVYDTRGSGRSLVRQIDRGGRAALFIPDNVSEPQDLAVFRHRSSASRSPFLPEPRGSSVVEGCAGVPRRSGASCATAAPTVTRFEYPYVAVATRGDEVVAVGEEWTESGPATWREPPTYAVIDNGGWERPYGPAVGKLLVLRRAGGTSRETVLPIVYDERMVPQVAVDRSGRIHVLLRSRVRQTNRYVLLRDEATVLARPL